MPLNEGMYPYTAKEARERGELELWRANFRANCACAGAIELAIRRDFDGMHLKDGCAKSVIDQYGYKRVGFVLANTLQELLMSAEYILSGGNENVILCERGIRTFDDYTRNTLDLAAVPMLKELTHLPIIVDPSHATGIARLVEPMALAATACGADGLIIEVHNDPMHALCDGAQSLRPEVYDDLAKKVRSIREVIAK